MHQSRDSKSVLPSLPLRRHPAQYVIGGGFIVSLFNDSRGNAAAAVALVVVVRP